MSHEQAFQWNRFQTGKVKEKGIFTKDRKMPSGDSQTMDTPGRGTGTHRGTREEKTPKYLELSEQEEEQVKRRPEANCLTPLGWTQILFKTSPELTEVLQG